MDYLGYRPDNSVVRHGWTANNSSGGRVDMSATPAQADFQVFKNGALMTLDASTITVTKTAATTGVYQVSVDTNNDADFTVGGFYEVLFYPDETADSQSVAQWLFCFDLGVPPVDVTQWGGNNIATPSIAGVPEVDLTHINADTVSVTDLKDFADSGYDPVNNWVNINLDQVLSGSPTADTVGDALKQATREEVPKRGAALNNIAFKILDVTDRISGLTGQAGSIAVQYAQDGATTFSAGTGTVTELANGLYYYDAPAGEMDAGVVVFRFSVAGGISSEITISTTE